MKKQKSLFALGKQLTSKEMKQLQGGICLLFPLLPIFFSDAGSTMMPPPFMLTASSANP